jgi:hypothetical protein
MQIKIIRFIGIVVSLTVGVLLIEYFLQSFLG